MPANPVLSKHLLELLRDLDGNSLAEDTLMSELEIRYGRPLTTQEARRTIVHAVDHNWARSRRDDFDQTRYWLTDKGRNQLEAM